MKAVGYRAPSPITDEGSLVDIDIPKPDARGRDLLVEVRAVSVNPVDYKVRRSTGPTDSEWKVLGWDAAGVVREVGEGVTLFHPGDEVYYAGAIGRPGTNAEFHLVDERIVGRKPRRLSWAEAAALPLTAITAWEALFDRLDVRRPVPGVADAILIVGGGGGVGSIAIQLARKLTELRVISTASRAETRAWGRGSRRPRGGRPCRADRAAASGARAQRARLRVLDDPYGTATSTTSPNSWRPRDGSCSSTRSKQSTSWR